MYFTHAVPHCWSQESFIYHMPFFWLYLLYEGPDYVSHLCPFLLLEAQCPEELNSILSQHIRLYVSSNLKDLSLVQVRLELTLQKGEHPATNSCFSISHSTAILQLKMLSHLLLFDKFHEFHFHFNFYHADFATSSSGSHGKWILFGLYFIQFYTIVNRK